jgi:hypothetical protein
MNVEGCVEGSCQVLLVTDRYVGIQSISLSLNQEGTSFFLY